MLFVMADFMKRKWRLLPLNAIQKQNVVESREVNEKDFAMNHSFLLVFVFTVLLFFCYSSRKRNQYKNSRFDNS